MRATVAADDTNQFFSCVVVVVVFQSVSLSLLGSMQCAMMSPVCFEIALFLCAAFFSSISHSSKCSFKNNLGNIKFIYLNAHYLAARY